MVSPRPRREQQARLGVHLAEGDVHVHVVSCAPVRVRLVGEGQEGGEVVKDGGQGRRGFEGMGAHF